MLHSPSPSPTSLLSLALAGLAAAASSLAVSGCGDDCGASGAPRTGLLASGAQVTLNYGDLSSGINNDCPDPGAPDGVISLTIAGKQTTDPAGLITFCVPRPDLLMQGQRSLGVSLSTADIRVVDIQGNANNCTFKLDPAQPPTGSVSATGVCDAGTSSDGFALSFDGGLSLRRTCGATIDNVSVTLRGRIAVTGPSM